MEISDDINELATALAKAQGAADRFAESRILVDLARLVWPRRGGNQNDGKIPIARFLDKVIFGTCECWYWRGAMHKLGYGLMNSMGETKAHRVSWRLFRGDIPDGLNVLHKCDVRNCVNPEHLFLGTQLENVRDMMSKGRDSFPKPRFGENNPVSKLTEDEVRAMRELHALGNHSYGLIGRIFGIATMNAHRIINRKMWRHVQ